MECKEEVPEWKARMMNVLIETSWNVKFEGTAYELGLKISINRNIVECKVQNAQDH